MDTTQFMKSTNGTIITVGKPYTFKSGIYGDTAVHVTAIHEDVIHFSIDGGEASRQVREFPELEDGTFYALSQRIEKRPTRARKPKAESRIASATYIPPADVKNTIRNVPGVGKVAVVTTTEEIF